METPAIVMMVVALVTVWGSLIASIIHLARSPEEH
ncbi:methionine/alanine import family NSS transporter small subunit [Nesterenkonia flava]|uniref:Methionine/alanine import family NSS transporter small subunit n=1 Tax=Nesterenkonia flava TaxID=469799 RepID=A0ABU1FTJ8_9MICC|nr:methionine/alanine import family NSS transporter small subunit [Nesterenkonia flava]MDR5711980.1 methionine/alanine import family NSS transporter small subunit [Nesterenkonia flava]